MNFRSPFIKTFIVALISIQAITGCVIAAPSMGTEENLLASVSDSLDLSLEQIDQNLTEIAGVFGISDMRNNTAADIVSPYQVHQEGLAGFILLVGDTVYPAISSSSLKMPFNSSLLRDTAISDSIQYIKPKMSQEKEIVDSKRVVLISRPTVVHDLIGAAIALIVPWSFCEAIIQPRINGTNALCTVMQLDGTILYTSHPNELTKIPPENFLTEFPTFRNVKTAMVSEKEGHMEYDLWRADRSEPKVRSAYWSTINLHGTEWRIMIAEPVD